MISNKIYNDLVFLLDFLVDFFLNDKDVVFRLRLVDLVVFNGIEFISRIKSG